MFKYTISSDWSFNGIRDRILSFYKTNIRPARLETALQRENNNFDLLRVLAATSVLVGHSYAISARSGFVDPVQRLIAFNYSGGLAVLLFFFLSGLLVTDSFQRNPDTTHFVLARIFRVFPGLAVCLFFTVFVIGAFFTTFSLNNYFRSPDTSSYYLNNLLLTNLQWRLPGVFTQSKYGLNGSLWTLPTEIRLYAGIAVLGFLRFFSFRWLLSLVLFGCFCVICAWQRPVPFLTESHELRLLSAAFVAGAVCALHKRYIPLNGLVAIGLWTVTVTCWRGPLRDPVFYGTFIYSCLFIFQLPISRKWLLPGDYSYGIYIYGFLIQQCVNGLFPGSTPWFNAAISIPICILFGAGSWHWVEKPCLLWIKQARLPDLKIIQESLHAFYRNGGVLISVLFVINLAPLILHLSATQASGTRDYSDLLILNYGPNNVKAGETFNRQPDGQAAIWVMSSRKLHPEAQLILGETTLVSAVSGDVITAKVPENIFVCPLTLSLSIREPASLGYVYSRAVDWNVVP